MLSGAGAIVLDEPTNHLDITSAQVMERALMYFPVPVVLVSRDRYFIEGTADQMLSFTDCGLRAGLLAG